MSKATSPAVAAAELITPAITDNKKNILFCSSPKNIKGPYKGAFWLNTESAMLQRIVISVIIVHYEGMNFPKRSSFQNPGGL